MHFMMLRFSPAFFLAAGLLIVAMMGLSSPGFAADSRFAVRLSGGLGYLGLTEMNNGLRGAMNDVWASY